VFGSELLGRTKFYHGLGAWINQEESEGLMAEWIMVGAMIITALATGVIAWYAVASHDLSSKISMRDEEDRQKTSDLFQAIVISNFLSHPDIDEGQAKTDRRIKLFKEKYKGKTPIHLIEKKE
jgi:hypothetical protein